MSSPRNSAPLRFLDNRGRPTMLGVNLPREGWRDVYHRTLAMSWPIFFGWATLAYLVAHALFAGLYLLEPGSIANAHDGDFLDAFFFSVQTMMTIGYGGMLPATRWANVLVSVEAYVGMLTTALLTGLVFARFARPTSNVLFSNVVCISVHDGERMLMMRCANARGNRIVEASLSVSLALTVRTKEGETFRRLRDLPLVRGRNSMFFVSWTAMHRIDESSPLWGETPESLAEKNAELLLVLTGIDEDMSATVHARRAYGVDEIRFGHRFADIIQPTTRDDGLRVIDYAKFHDTVPVEEGA